MQKGMWIICVSSYEIDGIEIPKGRMNYTYGRLPVNGLWRRATDEEIETKKWHRGNYYNLLSFK